MCDADYSGECNADSVRRYAYTKTSRGKPMDDNYEIDEYQLNGVGIYEISKSYYVVCI